MKKILILLCCAFLLCGCTVSTSDLSTHPSDSSLSTSAESSDSSSSKESSNPFPIQFEISGKYVCSGIIFNNDFFIEHPEWVTYISFSDDGSCIFYINYSEGDCIVNGLYSIHGNQIFMHIDLRDTVFQDAENNRHIDNYYVFSIINDNHITIDKEVYGVMPGDSFIRTE